MLGRTAMPKELVFAPDLCRPSWPVWARPLSRRRGPPVRFQWTTFTWTLLARCFLVTGAQVHHLLGSSNSLSEGPGDSINSFRNLGNPTRQGLPTTCAADVYYVIIAIGFSLLFLRERQPDRQSPSVAAPKASRAVLVMQRGSAP